MEVVFLRHAKTRFNELDLFCGTSDCDITENGRNDAHLLTKKLGSFSSFYCSPLKRTSQTLQAIFPDVKYTIDNRVIEICLGEWEGLPKSSVDQELRTSFKKGIYFPNNSESNDSVQNRIKSFLLDISKTYTGSERILVVTHGGFIRTLSQMLGVPTVKGNLDYISITDADILNLLKNT